jgi:hypothetical protein
LSANPTEKHVKEHVYLYCVILGSETQTFGRIGIGGRGAEVYAISNKDLTGVVSRIDAVSVPRTDENILAHQKVVQKAFDLAPIFPMQFSTIFESEDVVRQYLTERYEELHRTLESLKDVEPPIVSDPTRAVLKEALDHSLTSALRIRELSDTARGELTREQRREQFIEVSLRSELDGMEELTNHANSIAELVEVALKRMNSDRKE